MMRSKYTFIVFVGSFLFCCCNEGYASGLSFISASNFPSQISNSCQGNFKRSNDFQVAVSLYNKALYDEAKTKFLYLENIVNTDSEYIGIADESIASLAEGYRILCDMKLRIEGYEKSVLSYRRRYPHSILLPQIDFQLALNRFDRGNFEDALELFERVTLSELYREQELDYTFKKAYCHFCIGNFNYSRSGFERVLKMPYSDYSSPALFFIGFVHYNNLDFELAFRCFEKVKADERFKDACGYYMLECRFMLKDYKYVVNNADEIFARTPYDRMEHLARIISESYLVMGNSKKAREYYEKSTGELGLRGDRNDYFYAASLFYALGDYKAAIENFEKINDRVDSLGQVANYQLAYSYIKSKNKVAAMKSFKEAAMASFDEKIREDAYFNYAKLTFDLNKDPEAFKDYISTFSIKDKEEKIYSYMAIASLRNKDYSEAISYYDKIETLDKKMKGNYVRANYLRASQLMEGDAYRDAIPCLRAAAFYSDRKESINQLARYYLAESYYRNENFVDSRAIFTDLYNISALDGYLEGELIPFNIAYTFLSQQNYEAAAKWFEEYIDSGHQLMRKEAFMRRADCDFMLKNYYDAARGYEKVVKDYYNKDDIYPYYKQGIAFGLCGEMNEKLSALEKVKTANPAAQYYSETLFELGRTYYALGWERDAIHCFKSLQVNSSDSSYIARSMIELGTIFKNKSDYDEALSYYKRIVENMSDTEFAENSLLAIENIYSLKGKSDEFIAYADSLGLSSFKTEEDKELMYFNAAEQVFLNENYDKAISLLNNYIHKYPKGIKLSLAYFYMAEALKKIGNKEQACDYYVKVIDREEGGASEEIATLNYAVLSYALEHYTDALNGYEHLFQISKSENNLHLALMGMLHSAYKAKDYKKTISLANDMVKEKLLSSEDLILVKSMEAKSYLAISQRDKAFTILRKLSENPTNKEGAEAKYLLILDSYDKAKFEGLETEIYDFADKAPNQHYFLAKAFIVLGDTFMEKGNVVQARQTFESIVNGYVPSKDDEDDIIEIVKLRLEKLNTVDLNI